MIKVVLALFLAGCASKHSLIKNMTPSESPCIDGTLLNISKSGCDSLFWGIKDDVIKVRCTLTDNPSFWCTTAFYMTSIHNDAEADDSWTVFCADTGFVVFTGETLTRLENNETD